MREPRQHCWGLIVAVPVVAGVVTGEPPSREPLPLRLTLPVSCSTFTSMVVVSVICVGWGCHRWTVPSPNPIAAAVACPVAIFGGRWLSLFRRLCRRKQPLSPLCWSLSLVAVVLVTGCGVGVAGTAIGAAATWFPRARVAVVTAKVAWS
nr:uncharacterized protein LOC112784128 [Arachis hypogaea]